MQKWRPYLLGQSFKIKTDQQSLKFLLEQKVGTVTQQRWMSKLLGYDFVIEIERARKIKWLMPYLGFLKNLQCL